MSRATTEQRWTVADDLPGRPKVPVRCQQVVPGTAACCQQSTFQCDRCGKLICTSHTRVASAPRLADRSREHAADAGELSSWPTRDGTPVPRDARPFDSPRVDLCLTCRLLEDHFEIAIEEITREQRLTWLLTDAASAYISTETAEFEELRAPERYRPRGRERKT